MRACLSITTLGELTFQQNGETITSFPSRKAEALLVYLAVERETVHRRESLFTLLWPGMPERSARHNLRQVLYALRQTFGEVAAIDSDETVPLLLADRQTVQLNPDAAMVIDIYQLDQALETTQVHDHLTLGSCEECMEVLEKATDLYQGVFLGDFYLEDSNEFEDWVAANREAYRQKVLGILENLTEIHIQKGGYDAARTTANRQLQIDPLREVAYRQLMELLSKSGQRAEALRVYQQCANKLQIELGTHPSRETTALFEIIRGEDINKPTTPLQTGSIRGYEIREHLGSGHTGAVYKAYQPVIGRDVAIKVIQPQFANHPDFIRRFEVEAQLVARLEHPHIVPLYDYWRDPSGAYLVMRWLKGGNLQADLARGPWKAVTAVALVEQICAALALAHRQGVVHCDIKPANILLDDEGNAYLTDFGIAILTGPLAQLSHASLSGNGGSSSGSLGYVSPEVSRGLKTTPLADIYSLGVVLYEILTGTHPFLGIEGETLVRKHLTEALPSVLVARPELPAAVDAVIQQATQKDPAARYPDVGALAHDFRLALIPDSAAPHEISIPKVVTRNPYKGLRPFAEVDAVDFFGRVDLVARLLENLSPTDSALEPARFLAVVGPSGSGKSSVVKAGLIPALRQGAILGSERWFVAEMSPGAHPLEELETALLRIAVKTPDNLLAQLSGDPRGLVRVLRRALPEVKSEVLLVIDQFEELFTFVENETERNYFLELLAAAVRDPKSPLRLVITLRADFYDRPLGHSAFGELVRETTEVVLPLTPEELERAIRGPAEGVGSRLEPALVARILQEVGDQPGALPLLQYALTETFEHRKDHQLTLAAYETSGGVLGALGRRAEEIYTRLTPGQQSATRQMFLRLVTLGEGIEDTRRRVLRSEVEAVAGLQSSVIGPVINQYGSYRLLTFDHNLATRAPTVEVAHEALLREWPRLRSWLDESRDDVRMQRLLGAATQEWQDADRDPRLLLREARLDQFALWIEDTGVALTAAEQAYLSVSLAERKERQAAEARRQAHEAQLEQRSRRFLRALAAVLAVATVLALVLSGVAFSQNNIAQENAIFANQSAATATFAQGEALELADSRATQQAIAEEQAAARATQQAIAEDEARQRGAAEAVAQDNLRLARANELGAVSMNVMEKQPDLAFLLSVEAYRQANTLQNWTALYTVGTHNPQLRRVMRGHAGRVQGLAFSPDGKQLASAGHDGTIRLWDMDPNSAILGSSIELPHNLDAIIIESVDYSPDGLLLAASTVDGHVLLWDLDSTSPTYQQLVSVYATADPIFTGGADRSWVDFSPSDPILAAIPRSGQVEFLDVDQNSSTFGQPLGAIGNSPRFINVVFSPDGQTLAAVDCNFGPGKIYLWQFNLQDPSLSQELATLDPFPMCGLTATFSPDGKRLLMGTDPEHNVFIWDVEASSPSFGKPLAIMSGHEYFVVDTAISPDGNHGVSVGGWDRTALIWDIDPDSPTFGEQVMEPLRHASFVDSVEYSPDGETLAVGAANGGIYLWDMAQEIIPAVEIDIPPEFFWGYTEIPEPQVPHPLETLMQGHTGIIEGVVFSQDGKLLASAGGNTRTGGMGEVDGTVRLWDVDPDSPNYGQQIGDTLIGHTGEVSGLAYDSIRNRLASSGRDGTVWLWDINSGSPTFGQPLVAPFEGDQSEFIEVVISPDGRVVAAGDQVGRIFLWDIDPASSTLGQLLMQPIQAHKIGIEGMAFSSDGKLLATGTEGEYYLGMLLSSPIRLWNVDPESPTFGHLVTELKGGHTAGIYRVLFHPNEKIFASSSMDATIRLWDIDPESPTYGQVIGPPLVTEGMDVYGMAFSPDGKYLASSTVKGAKLQLWDVDLSSANFGQPLGVPLNQEGIYAVALAFSPNGKFLAIGDLYHRIHLWNVDPLAWVDYVCERAGRNLSEKEWNRYLSWAGSYDPNYKTCPQWP